MPDSVVQAVIDKFLERARLGKEKYGTDLDRGDLNALDWIKHAQEEHMDAILYLEKLRKVLIAEKGHDYPFSDFTSYGRAFEYAITNHYFDREYPSYAAHQCDGFDIKIVRDLLKSGASATEGLKIFSKIRYPYSTGVTKLIFEIMGILSEHI